MCMIQAEPEQALNTLEIGSGVHIIMYTIVSRASAYFQAPTPG